MIVLTHTPTETLAALLVARLESEGIYAEMAGALTSAFRAEAPGQVQILVREEDADRARSLLAQWRRGDDPDRDVDDAV